MYSFKELKGRFKGPKPLSDQDWKEFLSQVEDAPGAAATILLQARSGWEVVLAVRRFEESSAQLGRRLNQLTLVPVALTVVIALFTFLLWWRG